LEQVLQPTHKKEKRRIRKMALTLAEAAKLSNDVLLMGVIETIIYDSPVLQVLPFIEIVGNGLTYNQENQAPTVAFYDVGDTWAESTPTFTQQTATLKILGGDADVDNFLARPAAISRTSRLQWYSSRPRQCSKSSTTPSSTAIPPPTPSPSTA
jgi:hypothetical protein